MRRIFLTFLCVALVFGTWSVSEAEDDVRLAIFLPRRVLNVVDAVTALGKLTTPLAELTSTNLQWSAYRRAEDFEAAQARHNFDLAVLEAEYYLLERDKYNLTPVGYLERMGHPTESQVVLTKSQPDAPGLRALSDKTLAVSTSLQQQDVQRYLNRVVFEDEIDVSEYLDLHLTPDTPSAIAAVLYEEAAAALVPLTSASSVELAGDLNELLRSRPVPLPLVVVRDNSEFRDELRDYFVNLPPDVLTHLRESLQVSGIRPIDQPAASSALRELEQLLIEEAPKTYPFLVPEGARAPALETIPILGPLGD